jgi:hypothetical protein
LVIATILWPLVVPIYYLELLKARNLHLSSILPILLAIVFVSLLTYLGYSGFHLGEIHRT